MWELIFHHGDPLGPLFDPQKLMESWNSNFKWIGLIVMPDPTPFCFSLFTLVCFCVISSDWDILYSKHYFFYDQTIKFWICEIQLLWILILYFSLIVLGISANQI